jgi:hypothetical protein
VSVRQVVATLRDAELDLRVREATTALVVAEQEAVAARARGDQSGAQVAHLQTRDSEQRLAILREQLERARVRAPVAGVVLTPRPEERVGEWLRSGEVFVVLGRTDRLWLESGWRNRTSSAYTPARPSGCGLPALPGYTFVGRVTRIAPQADSSTASGEPTFVVRSELRNPQGLLRRGWRPRRRSWDGAGTGRLRPAPTSRAVDADEGLAMRSPARSPARAAHRRRLRALVVGALAAACGQEIDSMPDARTRLARSGTPDTVGAPGSAPRVSDPAAAAGRAGPTLSAGDERGWRGGALSHPTSTRTGRGRLQHAGRAGGGDAGAGAPRRAGRPRPAGQLLAVLEDARPR